MKDFITVDNVPFNWTERLHELESYTLYVSDCFLDARDRKLLRVLL